MSAIAVLALGLSASTIVFTITHALLLDPLEYRDAGGLSQLRERDPQGKLAPLTAADFRQAQHVSQPALVDMGMFMLTGVAEPEQFAGAAVTPNAFDVLGVHPILGHTLSVREPGEVLLSHDAWSRRFGSDPQIVGKVINLDWARTPQVERYRVAGVLPPRFWLFYRGLEVFVPLTDQILNDSSPRRRYMAFTRASLRSWPLDRPGLTLVATDLRHDVTEETRPALRLLSAAVAGLVLLVCANVANLFLVRGLRRREEFAVRIALGASRWHLARIVIAEATAVSICAVIIALPLAYAGLAALRRWLPGTGMMQFSPGFDKLAFDGWSLGFAAVAALLSCLLAAALPARQSSAVATQLWGSTSRQPHRQLLIAFEIALATVLLCGAGVLLKSVARIDGADIGFAREHMLVVRVPRLSAHPGSAYYQDLRQRVEAVPGVQAVAFASYQPLTHTHPERRFTIRDSVEASASYCVVSTNFFSTYRVPLKQGRAFMDADRSGAPPVVLISESLARKHFADRSPLGERLQFAGDSSASEIIGVVADIRQSLDRPAPDTVYRHAPQDPEAGLQMGVRTQIAPLDVARAIRREIGLAGGAAAELSTLDDFAFSESWRTRISGVMMTGFSALALVIAAFGVFAVISYTVNQRVREMGIRIALGAQPSDVIGMLLGEGLRPVGAGLIAGLIGAVALSRFLQGLLFDVQPVDFTSYGAAALVLLFAATGALAIPARRAAATDPGMSLRQR